jgi:para-aminobenzoate synthetase component 1
MSGRLTTLPVRFEPIRSDATPVEVFRRIASRDGSFFLDSALYNPRFGRYSFIGVEPVAVLSAEGDVIALRSNDGERKFKADPFGALCSLIENHSPLFRPERPAEDNAPVPFCGGLVGYLGYDLRRFIERLPSAGKKDQRFPDMHFGLYDRVLCWDADEKKWWLAKAETGAPSDSERVLRDALSAASGPAPSLSPQKIIPAQPISNFTREEYVRAVRRVIDYIAAGDIFQANLSQRFEVKCEKPPADLYERLRSMNPAPFAAFIRLDGEKCVMSSSPERFLRVNGGDVETRPIKGTRPRSAEPRVDEKMKRELLASAKDAAELAMIVDLERNDLGRVCEFGSVKVAEQRVLETYATVHHLVATVAGKLRPNENVVSLLRATFPGGSITGAPKIRAMEIIDELEPTARAVYTGAIGYLGFGGRADLNIAIRTILFDAGRVTFQVGGGIVADSEPEREFEETIHKASGIMKALNIAQNLEGLKNGSQG